MDDLTIKHTLHLVVYNMENGLFFCCSQGFCKETAAVECFKNPAKELCSIFKTKALAVVESFHKGWLFLLLTLLIV